MKNLTEQMAIDFLKSKGYLTDYFFHRINVQRNYGATDEEADDIIRNVVGCDGIMERIQDGIEILCEANQIKPNQYVTEADLMGMSRDGIIGWLCWNDRNGIYLDDECELEGIDPLTREEALEMALDQVRG
jgi:hypothetical protein